MSNFVGNKPNPLSMLIKGAQKVFGKTQKTTGTGAISSVNIAKNLAKKKTIKDDMIKARDKQLAGVRDEAKIAIKSKASYLAFGAFYSTKTKKTKFNATAKILKKVKKLTKIPIVAIGGINSSNYKNLLLNKANFLAISGYIWNNKKYKPEKAIKLLK